MYSMVLMAALTTGTDLPDFGRRGGCCGCYGGYGYGYGGCYGGYGWGGGYGRYAGGWGGWGGGYGGYGGGWGGWGGWGYAYSPVISTYASPVIVANTLPPTTAVARSMYYSPDSTSNNRATIIVHVPANATLVVDGKPTRSTSETRRFYSPPLEPGKSYHYTFEARMERDGQMVKVDKRVDVGAGDRRVITLTMPDLDQAAERQHPATQPAERNGLPERRVSGEPR